ncbi:hypothetical protein TFLX_00808 [Thermoflexales bacterium]|nr:hypothetical protein TFLX_00808 [Thermoflexales bacterium]
MLSASRLNKKISRNPTKSCRSATERKFSGRRLSFSAMDSHVLTLAAIGKPSCTLCSSTKICSCRASSSQNRRARGSMLKYSFRSSSVGFCLDNSTSITPHCCLQEAELFLHPASSPHPNTPAPFPSPDLLYQERGLRGEVKKSDPSSAPDGYALPATPAVLPPSTRSCRRRSCRAGPGRLRGSPRP